MALSIFLLIAIIALGGDARGAVPFFRYFNGGICDHFYTTNWGELGQGRHGWKYEKTEGNIYKSRVSGTVPLYRWWNGRDHFYTGDSLSFRNYGYKSEGVAGYCFPRDQGSSTIPLYRWYAGGSCNNHFYTTSYTEGRRSGYKYEGVVCYVVKDGHVKDSCNNPKCDVCKPLLDYENAAIVCRDRITKAKNNAQDVKDKIDVMHWLSQKAKSAKDTIAKIDRFMRANSHIINKIPKVGRLVIHVSNSLDKFGDVMDMIGSKEPLLAKLKARLDHGIKTLNGARDTVDMSVKIAHQGRDALITASKVECCTSIDLTASNYFLTSAVIRTATNVMDKCATFDINVVLPSINPDLLNVIGAIADVVERVRKWIEEIKNAILRDADYFMCCEDFGRFLGDVAEVFGDLVGLVTCVETGAMGGILDESFDVLLKSLSPLFDGLNNQIRKYNRFTTEFEKSVRVKVLGFKTSSKNVDDKTRGCKVEMPNISPFSSFDISADITMPKLSEIKFAFGSGQFNVQKVFGNIAAECEDAGKSLVTLDKFDCCDIAQRYPDGTTCLKGTSCKACKNPATWWAGAFMTKCGREPCWGGGTTCGAGTSCNSCCSGAHCPWYWAGFCKCK